MSPIIAASTSELLLTTIVGVTTISTLGYLVGCFMNKATRRHLVCAGALLAIVTFSTSVILFESQDLRISAISLLPVPDESLARPIAFTEPKKDASASPSWQSMGHFDTHLPDKAMHDRSSAEGFNPEAFSLPRFRRLDVLCVLWAVGSIAMLLRLVGDLCRLRYVIRNASSPSSARVVSAMERCSRSLSLRRLPELLVSDRSVTAFSVRLPRLSVFLPRDLVCSLTDEEIEQVLMHELAHIARRDQYWLILQRIAESVFWFVPTVF